jgi:hypothetical protein
MKDFSSTLRERTLVLLLEVADVLTSSTIQTTRTMSFGPMLELLDMLLQLRRPHLVLLSSRQTEHSSILPSIPYNLLILPLKSLMERAISFSLR